MKRFIRSVIAMLLGVFLPTGTALAQAPARLTNDDQGMLVWIIAGGLVAVVGLPAFIKSKRSHLS